MKMFGKPKPSVGHDLELGLGTSGQLTQGTILISI